MMILSSLFMRGERLVMQTRQATYFMSLSYRAYHYSYTNFCPKLVICQLTRQNL